MKFLKKKINEGELLWEYIKVHYKSVYSTIIKVVWY